MLSEWYFDACAARYHERYPDQCAAVDVQLLLGHIKEQEEVIAKLTEALKAMQSALDFYSEEIGPIHDDGCSEDDCCECPNMKMVNGAWSKAEAALSSLPQPQEKKGDNL